MKQTLLEGLPSLGLDLTTAQLDTFCAFGEALIEKNRVMNLTAITDPQAVAQLHFLDCMALLNFWDFTEKSVIDVRLRCRIPRCPFKNCRTNHSSNTAGQLAETNRLA